MTKYPSRYLIGLLQLLKTLTKALVEVSFITGRGRNPVTCDMKVFATILHGCKIWTRMLNMAGLAN